MLSKGLIENRCLYSEEIKRFRNVVEEISRISGVGLVGNDKNEAVEI